ncbi:MAG: CinA family protein [Opitutae bacterium]|nr:CinA family protein [Opitutae bacterium]
MHPSTELKRLLLREPRLTLAVAESLTCGHVQARIGEAAGASGYFLGGVTAYALEEKVKLLDAGCVVGVAPPAARPAGGGVGAGAVSRGGAGGDAGGGGGHGVARTRGVSAGIPGAKNPPLSAAGFAW